MITSKRVPVNILSLIAWALAAFVTSCSSEQSDDSIPYLPFSPLTIQLTNPEFQQLNTLGHISLSQIGVKGVILYRQNASTYLAYEQNCSYQPNEACAFVQVDQSNLYMTDVCCGSSFNFESGSPIGGPAWRPLRRYTTILDGNTLTITDEIAN